MFKLIFMNTVVYVFDDLHPIPAGVPTEVADISDLEKKCARILSQDGVYAVSAFNMSRTALLFDGRKSEKQRGVKK
jgi:hypothetical protein